MRRIHRPCDIVIMFFTDLWIQLFYKCNTDLYALLVYRRDYNKSGDKVARLLDPKYMSQKSSETTPHVQLHKIVLLIISASISVASPKGIDFLTCALLRTTGSTNFVHLPSDFVSCRIILLRQAQKLQGRSECYDRGRGLLRKGLVLSVVHYDTIHFYYMYM